MRKITGAVFVISFVFSASSIFAGEAPMLAEMVKAGELPPLEERLPENPLVEVPVSEIGTYGDKLVLGTAFFLDDERLPVRVDRNGFFQFTYPFPRANTANFLLKGQYCPILQSPGIGTTMAPS